MRRLHSVLIAASFAFSIAVSPCARAQAQEETAVRIVTEGYWAEYCGVVLGPIATEALKYANEELRLKNTAPANSALPVKAILEFSRFSEQEKIVRCFTLTVAYSQ